MDDSLSPIVLLETAGEVIDAVGGTAEAHRLTKSSMGAVSNWRATGRLAPRTFLLFDAALADLGKAAPSMLWGIAPGRKSTAGVWI